MMEPLASKKQGFVTLNIINISFAATLVCLRRLHAVARVRTIIVFHKGNVFAAPQVTHVTVGGCAAEQLTLQLEHIGNAPFYDDKDKTHSTSPA